MSILAHPLVWDVLRFSLDMTFGTYRKRVAVMRQWGLLDKNYSYLDVGCGTGHYASLLPGDYLGLDFSPEYIAHARTRYASDRARFECADLNDAIEQNQRFSVVLLVDILHHLERDSCIRLLKDCAARATVGLVNFEPIAEQDNAAGRWMVEHDRGDYIRPLADTRALYTDAGLTIARESTFKLGPTTTKAFLWTPSHV